MDKLLLRTFAIIAVASIILIGFTAIIQSGQAQAQIEAFLQPTSTVAPTETVFTPDSARGQEIFEHGVENAPACAVCHLVEKIPGRYSVGPLLKGVATRASQRVAGLSAEEYLYESVTSPGSYTVNGFANAMFSKYSEVLTQEQIADVIAYLMTLE